MTPKPFLPSQTTSKVSDSYLLPLRSINAKEAIHNYEANIDREPLAAAFRKAFVKTLKEKIEYVKVPPTQTNKIEEEAVVQKLLSSKCCPNEFGVCISSSTPFLKHKRLLVEASEAQRLGESIGSSAYNILFEFVKEREREAQHLKTSIASNGFGVLFAKSSIGDQNLKTLVLEKIVTGKYFDLFFKEKIEKLTAEIASPTISQNSTPAESQLAVEVEDNKPPKKSFWCLCS